jgi:hypothetical protein
MASVRAARGGVPVAGIVVAVAGVALMAALSWQTAGRLPDPVTFTGTGRDGADQQAPKAFVLSIMPLLTLTLGAVLLSAQRMRRATASTLGIPMWRDEQTHRRAVNLGVGVLIPVLLALHVFTLWAAQGDTGLGMTFVAAAVALLITLAGNVWPKQKLALPDHVRTAVDSRVDDMLEAHRRKVRPIGVAIMLIGLLALASSWLSPLISLSLSFVAVLILVCATLFTAFSSVRKLRSPR